MQKSRRLGRGVVMGAGMLKFGMVKTRVKKIWTARKGHVRLLSWK